MNAHGELKSPAISRGCEFSVDFRDNHIIGEKCFPIRRIPEITKMSTSKRSNTADTMNAQTFTTRDDALISNGATFTWFGMNFQVTEFP